MSGRAKDAAPPPAAPPATRRSQRAQRLASPRRGTDAQVSHSGRFRFSRLSGSRGGRTRASRWPQHPQRLSSRNARAARPWPAAPRLADAQLKTARTRALWCGRRYLPVLQLVTLASTPLTAGYAVLGLATSPIVVPLLIVLRLIKFTLFSPLVSCAWW